MHRTETRSKSRVARTRSRTSPQREGQNVDGLWTHASLAWLESDACPFGQCPGAPVADDAAAMDERIPAVFVGTDEAVAVLFVEPLDRATRQERSTSYFLLS